LPLLQSIDILKNKVQKYKDNICSYLHVELEVEISQIENEELSSSIQIESDLQIINEFNTSFPCKAPSEYTLLQPQTPKFNECFHLFPDFHGIFLFDDNYRYESSKELLKNAIKAKKELVEAELQNFRRYINRNNENLIEYHFFQNQRRMHIGAIWASRKLGSYERGGYTDQTGINRFVLILFC
jgi:hypothetical protein